MTKQLLILLLLLIGTITSNLDAKICTLSGSEADSLIQALPRDSAHFRQIGVLFTNRVFLNKSEDGKQDADSAIWYLEQAFELDKLPETEIYLCIAKAIRAKKDHWYQKALGGTKTRVTTIFYRADTLALQSPNDFAIQFLAANLFVEAGPLDSAKYFWERCLTISQALMFYCDGEQILSPSPEESFFDSEVLGTILLNTAKVELKISGNSKNVLRLVRLKWQAVIIMYPYTMAAWNAKKQLDETD